MPMVRFPSLGFQATGDDRSSRKIHEKRMRQNRRIVKIEFLRSVSRRCVGSRVPRGDAARFGIYLKPGTTGTKRRWSAIDVNFEVSGHPASCRTSVLHLLPPPLLRPTGNIVKIVRFIEPSPVHNLFSDKNSLTFSRSWRGK